RAALGDEVAVAAVGREQVVVVPERRAHAGGDGLLAYREVDEARYAPRRVELARALLGAADPQHGRVHLEAQIGAGARAQGARSRPRGGGKGTLPLLAASRGPWRGCPGLCSRRAASGRRARPRPAGAGHRAAAGTLGLGWWVGAGTCRASGGGTRSARRA